MERTNAQIPLARGRVDRRNNCPGPRSRNMYLLVEGEIVCVRLK
jgi:hypothetical protein